MKVVKLSALHTGRLYPTGNTPGTRFYWRLSRPQVHSAARGIMSMKNSNDTIGNRTRDLPACGTVHQRNVTCAVLSLLTKTFVDTDIQPWLILPAPLCTCKQQSNYSPQRRTQMPH